MSLVSRLSVAVTTATSEEKIAAMETAAAPFSPKGKARGIMNSTGCRGAGLQHTSRELKIWETGAHRTGRKNWRGLAFLGSLQMQWRTTELILQAALPRSFFFFFFFF